MVQIINIIKSKRKDKRYTAILDDYKSINFGLDTGSTYIDHHNETKRENYRKRHYANKTEKYNIDNLIISPSLLSYYLLWGPYTELNKNLHYLNKLLDEKYN